jgi:REP element-mobilizing transposase RayT
LPEVNPLPTPQYSNAAALSFYPTVQPFFCFNCLDDCQVLVATGDVRYYFSDVGDTRSQSQGLRNTVYTLTYFADHCEKFSHNALNRYLRGEKMTPHL